MWTIRGTRTVFVCVQKHLSEISFPEQTTSHISQAKIRSHASFKSITDKSCWLRQLNLYHLKHVEEEWMPEKKIFFFQKEEGRHDYWVGNQKSLGKVQWPQSSWTVLDHTCYSSGWNDASIFDMLSLVLLGELGKNIKGFINSFSEFIRCIIFW